MGDALFQTNLCRDNLLQSEVPREDNLLQRKVSSGQVILEESVWGGGGGILLFSFLRKFC